MIKETEENQEENQEANEFSNENMFDFDALEERQEKENDEDIEDFKFFSSSPKNEDDENEENENEENEGNEDDDEKNKDDFDFNENEEESKDDKDKNEDDEDLDLKAFNEKFSTSFKDNQELKEFLKGKDKNEEDKSDDKTLEEANNQIAILSPYLELNESGTDHKIDDEGLMRSQFESIAMQENKDLNNEDVQIEIEEKIQDLKDSGKLYKSANLLRNQLKTVVENYTKSKTSIETKREDAKKASEKETKENLQNEFINLHSSKNFYGVELDKELISKTYKDVVSGKFLENLKNNNKAIAELALMAATKEKIFKKSTGLTYSDGLKAITDEFKSASEKDSPISEAQKRGTAASKKGTEGLIADILYNKPKEGK